VTDERLQQNIVDIIKKKFPLLSAKKRYYVGDGITWGDSPIDGSYNENNLVKLVKDILGLATANNYGSSGSTLASPLNGTRNPMVDRYTSIVDADLICVFGGRNDWNFEVPLGTINDTSSRIYMVEIAQTIRLRATILTTEMP